MASGSILGTVRVTCIAMLSASGCTPASEPTRDVAHGPVANEPPVEIGKRDVPSAPGKVASVPAAAPVKSEPVPAKPRRVVFFVDAGESKGHERGRAWLLGNGDDTRKVLPWTVDSAASGSVGVGSSLPVLSSDGRWLAFTDLSRLAIADLDGTAKARRVTQSSNVGLLISGFAPDGSTLLFHMEEIPGEEESIPLPPGVQAGFHRLRLPAFVSEHVPALHAFEAWTDSAHVLHIREEHGQTRLVESDLAGGERELQTHARPSAFSQLVVQGERMYWTRSPRVSSAQVASARLDGSDLVELTEPRGFAALQWPRPAPGGQHVAYFEVYHPPAGRPRQSVAIVDTGTREAKTLFTCKARCRHQWDSASTILVLDDRELIRLRLDGSTESLEDDVVDFTVAGETR